MSKNITVTPEMIDQIRDEFEKSLTKLRAADGKFTFTKTFENTSRKAEIIYTQDAWTKQCAVVREFQQEVAWYCVAYRDEDETKDVYHITDVLVYPQTVGPASVDVDLGAMATWLMENEEDERFNHLCCQCHSHVNMSTSPSTTDLKHQKDELDTLYGDRFHIFMIWNKSNQSTKWIYDLKKNCLFENADITVSVEGQESLGEFLKQAKAMVSDKRYTTASTTAAAVPTTQKPAVQTSVVTNAVSAASTGKAVTPANPPKKAKPKAVAAGGFGNFGWHSAADDDDDDDDAMESMWGPGYRSPFYYSER